MSMKSAVLLMAVLVPTPVPVRLPIARCMIQTYIVI
jgi:hypothetical protein